MKTRFLLLLLAALLLVPSVSGHAATKTSKIQASINKLAIKVNGQLAGGNNILYNNTTYVPIRNITEMLNGVTLSYDQKKNIISFTKTTGTGAPAASSKDDARDKPRDGKIEVAFNTVAIQVDGKSVATSNFMYKGRTYVPMRAITDILKVPVQYHKPNATVYIGTIPAGELEAATAAASSKFGNVAGTGEMSGWRKLTGHPYEKQAEFYYQVEGSIIRYAVKDIRKINLDEVIYWVDDDGRKRANTRRDLHRVFGGFSEYTSDWFLAKFGDVYMDYFEATQLPYEQLINQYLKETGQIKPPASQVTLQPGTTFEPVQPKPGYGKWGDGRVVYYAFDKYGNHKYQFVDTNDRNWNRYNSDPSMPIAPKLSEGWMVDSILAQIYGQQATYSNYVYRIQNEKEIVLELHFPSDWHRIDVMETTVNNIRVKKYYFDLDERISGEWVTVEDLEKKAGIYLGINGPSETVEGAYERRFYKGDYNEGYTTLLTVDIPNQMPEPYESKGLRMKREGPNLYFKVEDLYRLKVIEPLTESNGFSMYFNVEDLTAAGILK